MTKNKTLFLGALLLIFLGIINSCRNEDFYEKTQKEKKNFKVYMLNKKQITDDFFLFDKVAKIQSVLIERNAQARSIQDSILDGGTISINKVLVVENENGIKTYTFPLKRSFAPSKIENLVLKRNADSTFSGVLMQYDITPTEKEMFNNWSSIDIKPKTKIINIDNLSITTFARVVEYQIGCFILEYEDGTCASTCQHTNPAECRLSGSQAPQPPRILSITAIPDCEPSGGDDGSTSNPPENTNNPPSNPTYPMSGGDTNTMLFDDYDLTYYNSDDMTDPDFQFYYQVNQWMQSQSQIVKNLNNEYHYVFYFVHTYFKTNGLNNTTKAFVSQSLLQIAQWYYDQTTGTHLDYEQKKSIAIWSVKYLLENLEVSWEDYKNQFLTSPCENLKAKETDTNFNSKVQELKQDANGLAEAGMVTYNDNPKYGNKNYGGVDSNGNSFVKLDVDWNRISSITGFMHCHLNNLDIPMLRTLTVFSMSDFIALAQLVQNSQASITDMGMYVTSNRGTFVIKLTNKQAIIDFANYIKNNIEKVDKFYNKNIKYNMPKNKQIKGLLGLIKDSGFGTGIDLYEGDSNFKNWKKHTLDDNNNLQTTPCP